MHAGEHFCRCRSALPQLRKFEATRLRPSRKLCSQSSRAPAMPELLWDIDHKALHNICPPIFINSPPPGYFSSLKTDKAVVVVVLEVIKNFLSGPS
ncbi:MAG: hypothetical protein NTW59_00670, partial [Candidatus Diapherotrites archaeon]|nr:hypothetical protein [Candidatus Diapherotrites archaeon]